MKYPKTFTGISHGTCVIRGHIVTAEEFTVFMAKTDFALQQRFNGPLTYEQVLARSMKTVAELTEWPRLSGSLNKEKTMGKAKQTEQVVPETKTMEQVLETPVPQAPKLLTLVELNEKVSSLEKRIEALGTPSKEPQKAAAKPSTQKTKRIVTPEQKAKLQAAREAWFKKKGYGKYAQK